MRKRITICILILTLVITAGCSTEGRGGQDEDKDKIKVPELKSEIIHGDDEILTYDLPRYFMMTSGFDTPEEWAEDWSDEEANPNQKYFNSVEPNDKGGITITTTGRKLEREKTFFYDQLVGHVNKAKEDEDTTVTINEDYSEVIFELGEDTESVVFTCVSIVPLVGMLRIYNDKEDWRFHFMIIKDGEKLVDLQDPSDDWSIPGSKFKQ